jgi:hypothetical protein
MNRIRAGVPLLFVPRSPMDSLTMPPRGEFVLKTAYLIRLLLLAGSTIASCSGVRAAADLNQPAAGINLAGPADWNTELPFVDVFRLSRAWISQKRGEGWGKGPALDLDEHGWVRRLEPGCFAETPLCTIDDGHYPSGVWTVLWVRDALNFPKERSSRASRGV